jgi:hypothetical protein
LYPSQPAPTALRRRPARRCVTKAPPPGKAQQGYLERLEAMTRFAGSAARFYVVFAASGTCNFR